MRESKSRALPLGDTAIFKRCVVFPTVTGLFPVATEGDAVGTPSRIRTDTEWILSPSPTTYWDMGAFVSP